MDLTIAAQTRWVQLQAEARREAVLAPDPDNHCLIAGDLVDDVTDLEAEFIVRSHDELMAEYDEYDTFCGVPETSWAVVLYNRLYAILDEHNPESEFYNERGDAE